MEINENKLIKQKDYIWRCIHNGKIAGRFKKIKEVLTSQPRKFAL